MDGVEHQAHYALARPQPPRIRDTWHHGPEMLREHVADLQLLSEEPGVPALLIGLGSGIRWSGSNSRLHHLDAGGAGGL